MKKQPIFVAVDTNNHKRASEIINSTKNYIYGVKFGLEFFCSKGGREAIKKFKNKNVKIFLDLKLKDIPNTVYKAIKSLKDISPDYLTIHATGGEKMMKAAKKAQSETNKKMKILAVTILTSLTNKDLKKWDQTQLFKHKFKNLHKLQDLQKFMVLFVPLMK